MQDKHARYDAVIIGGGFFGLRIALFLVENIKLKRVLILEQSDEAMNRASYVNQARVHNGYHYPRSILTAHRSATNFRSFVEEYQSAIVNNFDKHYAIARQLSKVNARQFKSFCQKIGVKVEDAERDIVNLFTPHMTEAVFEVEEYAFDSRKLRAHLLERIERSNNIDLIYNHEVISLVAATGGISVETKDQIFFGRKVFNCTYAHINTLHRQLGMPLVPLKHEIAEMCLVKLPAALQNFSITIMDGPFFSIMPFPSRGLHTLSHVRYTPHISWVDNEETSKERHDTYEYYRKYSLRSAYKSMKADVLRYIPALETMEYVDSISDVKTVLLKSESDDSRPILFRNDFDLDGYTCIMGGKLDNIYDVFTELEILYGKTT